MKKLIICDKNFEYIEKCKEAFKEYDNIKCIHGDIIELHEKTPNSRIVTASNPSFSPDGGLDYQLANKYNWQGGEFKMDNDLFYIISVDNDRKANNKIIQRAVAGVYAHSNKCDMIMSCIGCGIGKMELDIFIKNIKNIFGENNLCSADLRFANLGYADLRSANLGFANLGYAVLRSANLSSADLTSADLTSAKLCSADLENIKINKSTTGILSVCPERGSFIGWKKAKDGAIIKLQIPASAMRSSATTRKCRCSKAKVLKIWDNEANEINEAYSDYNHYFTYKKGETVKVDDFDKDRWNECSAGIHFFITKEEAIQYNS